jgi:putative PIG3 family NAD(P)H quinone oxidoreductase
VRAIVFEEFGDEGVLRWDEVPDPSCGPGQVVIETRATSVNRADLLQRQGFYPPPPGASEILGLEGAGRIVEVGDEVADWSVGNEAMALLAGGGYAERVSVDARHLLPVPKAIGLPDAGGVPEVYLTAYLNLVELGGLEPGKRVLVHGGSGGVGTAAIQLARHLGAEVWTTAGSADRAARCAELGAHRALDYHEQDYVAELQAVGGADLILDVMGAKYLEGNLKSLRPDGRLVVIGLQGGTKGSLNLGLALARRLTVVGSTLRSRDADDKAGIIARFREKVWPLLEAGRLRLVVERRLPLREAAEAHRLMADGQRFGKLILEVANDHPS